MDLTLDGTSNKLSLQDSIQAPAEHSGTTISTDNTQEVVPSHSLGAHASPLLTLVYLIWKLQIPTIDPYIVDSQKRVNTAIGTLGKGGQYVVDRVYDNQRSSCYGLDLFRHNIYNH